MLDGGEGRGEVEEYSLRALPPAASSSILSSTSRRFAIIERPGRNPLWLSVIRRATKGSIAIRIALASNRLPALAKLSGRTPRGAHAPVPSSIWQFGVLGKKMSRDSLKPGQSVASIAWARAGSSPGGPRTRSALPENQAASTRRKGCHRGRGPSSQIGAARPRRVHGGDAAVEGRGGTALQGQLGIPLQAGGDLPRGPRLC